MDRQQHIYHVYIMTNKHHTVFYTGMTGQGLHRIKQHIKKVNPGFTNYYKIQKLVYIETHTDVRQAIAREKQIKRWSRKKKIALIESINPTWKDLFVHYNKQQ